MDTELAGLRTARRALRLPAFALALLAVLALAGCSLAEPGGAGPLRYRDAVFGNLTVTQNIQYGVAPDNSGNPVPLMLDLYQPAGDTATARPAVVWVHGGGFCCGDKSSGASANLAQEFAHYGYVTVSINYRLLAPNGCTGGNGVSAQCDAAALAAIYDAKAAVRWLRANATTYGIDPNRIGIGGDSAGGIVASGVGMDPSDPGSSGNPGYSDAVGAFMSLSGGLPGGLFAAPGDAPGLLFSGTADPIVPYAWSVQTAQALLNAGVAAFLESFPGAGHDPYTQYQSTIDPQTDYFFYDFLDAADAQGSPPAARRAFAREAQSLARRYPAFARQLRAEQARERRR